MLASLVELLRERVQLRLVGRLDERNRLGLALVDAEQREVHAVAERRMDVVLVVELARQGTEDVGENLPLLRVEIRVGAYISKGARRNETRRIRARRCLGCGAASTAA